MSGRVQARKFVPKSGARKADTGPEPCPLNPSGIVRFGGALAAYLHSNEGDKLLDAGTKSLARGWTRGGCGYLAGALKRWAPDFVQRKSLEFDYGRGTGLDHVVAKVDGYYIDGKGAFTERELRQMWPHDFLAPYCPARARRDVLQCNLGAYLQLTTAIKKKFGRPEDWFCSKRR